MVELTLLQVWETYAAQGSVSVTVKPIHFPSSTCSSIWLPSGYDLDNAFEIELLTIFILT